MAHAVDPELLVVDSPRLYRSNDKCCSLAICVRTHRTTVERPTAELADATSPVYPFERGKEWAIGGRALGRAAGDYCPFCPWPVYRVSGTGSLADDWKVALTRRTAFVLSCMRTPRSIFVDISDGSIDAAERRGQ